MIEIVVIAGIVIFIILGRRSGRFGKSWDNTRKSWDHVFPSQEKRRR